MVEAIVQKLIKIGTVVKRAKIMVSHKPPPTARAMYHGMKRRRPIRR